MFDPAILLSLEPRLPPEPPPMVEERVLRDAGVEQWERIGRRMADGFERDAERYIAMLAAMRSVPGEAVLENVGSAEEMARLTRIIDDLERAAEARARRAARVRKRVDRQAKAEAVTLPAVALARRRIAARMLAMDRQLVDAVLDHTLFLRALRSEIDPAGRDAPTFDDAAGLRDHLARLGAV